MCSSQFANIDVDMPKSVERREKEPVAVRAFVQPQLPRFQTNAPKFPSHQTVVSPLLLSHLSPHRRAQNLLILMASLASKLFEASPNAPHWLNAYSGSLPSFLSSQTQLLPSTLLPCPSSTKEILSMFFTLQTLLSEAVAQLQEALDLQEEMQKIAQQVQSMDAALLCFTKKLREAEQVLDNLGDDYSDLRPQEEKMSMCSFPFFLFSFIRITSLLSAKVTRRCCINGLHHSIFVLLVGSF